MFDLKKSTDDNINYDIEIEQCKGDKYIGTDWNINKSDKTIKLKDYDNYCLTYNGKNNSTTPETGLENTKSKLFISKCKDDLKNQQFETINNNIQLYIPTETVKKYCLHHTKK